MMTSKFSRIVNLVGKVHTRLLNILQSRWAKIEFKLEPLSLSYRVRSKHLI